MTRCLTENSLISVGHYSLNSFWFYHFTELYRLHGQKIRPNIACKVFEIVMYIRTWLTKNRAVVNQLFDVGTLYDNKSALTNIQFSDDMYNVRQYIMCECTDKAALLSKEQGDKNVLQLAEEDTAKKPFKYEKHSFKGFPLITCNTVRPVKI